MRSFYKRLARKGLFALPPETAHRLSLKALSAGLPPGPGPVYDRRLEQRVAGLDFPNPVGLAAGYDKDGEVPRAIFKLGFGFTEIGTVTPRPQAGNPRPRLYRLARDAAVINRLGFNNQGHAALRHRLARLGDGQDSKAGPVGINIGANKDSTDFIADYVAGIAAFAEFADYFAINISSPNTPGLRGLQSTEALDRLLTAVFTALEQQSRRPPVFLKLSPDVDEDDIEPVAAVIAASPLAGVMIGNTTLSRPKLREAHFAKEAGGLSGAPLFHRSTVMLARFREALPSRLPLIGIGGVSDAGSAISKLEAGASLVQLYTGLIYEGPFLAADICRGILAHMEKRGVTHLGAITGGKMREWAAKPLENDQ